jgi:molybdopterin-biosynthesis enzyme MoeA-like protein
MNTPPNIGLVIVGDEILSGKRQDKHLAKVIALLTARGLALSWARYVGDDRPRIIAALREAFTSGDIAFSCGGIGATPDDHTRQCAAAALGVELALHPEARGLILERRHRAGPALRARSRRQPAPPEHGRVPGRRLDHP